MKKTALVISMLLLLGPLGAAAMEQPLDDRVTLKDGRVLHGQVIEESNDKIMVMVGGVKRTFGRSFVKKVAYGAGPAGGDQQTMSAGAASTGAAGQPGPPEGVIPSTPPKGDLVADLSLRYRVPEGDVVWVRRQGIADSDLPLVFLVAATAGVVPRAIVKLRLAGWSWDDIETRYGMRSSAVYYEQGPWADYPYYYYPGDGWWGWGGYGYYGCLLYTSPSPRDRQKSRMPSSA